MQRRIHIWAWSGNACFVWDKSNLKWTEANQTMKLFLENLFLKRRRTILPVISPWFQSLHLWRYGGVVSYDVDFSQNLKKKSWPGLFVSGKILFITTTDAPKALALTPTCKIHVPLKKMQSLSLNVNVSFQRQVELLIRGTVYFQVVRLLIQCIPLGVVHCSTTLYLSSVGLYLWHLLKGGQWNSSFKLLQ